MKKAVKKDNEGKEMSKLYKLAFMLVAVSIFMLTFRYIDNQTMSDWKKLSGIVLIIALVCIMGTFAEKMGKRYQPRNALVIGFIACYCIFYLYLLNKI
ncbi:hypothetical protein E2R51_15560 [Jeotgalibacillus sp. S-D1]|uniref:hypothetical protein n=1 Tax=Jeotgalibacillus sp. S-D1 TaxID=2552189 RepID=UPI0010599F38|nr:hypothetical protein [Jeotgalibacillus sp. S-D1]TDL31200.1 hypothetical protein E2R51_15560 [Jeotgalibacillus sp. S-D1]